MAHRWMSAFLAVQQNRFYLILSVCGISLCTVHVVKPQDKSSFLRYPKLSCNPSVIHSNGYEWCIAALQVALTVGPVGKLFGVNIPNCHLWSPADPFLYDVIVSLTSTAPLPLQSTAFFAISTPVGLASCNKAYGRRHHSHAAVYQCCSDIGNVYYMHVYQIPLLCRCRSDSLMLIKLQACSCRHQPQ